MRFILLGKEYDLVPEDVQRRMTEQQPEAIRNHYVTVNGRLYPPKQVLEAVTGLSRASFTTQNAHSVLRRLGFELGQIDGKPDPKRLEAARRVDEARKRTGPIG